MKPREFARYLARDLHCPCGCVGREDTFVPQHRANRGMGGSPAADRPSNIIVLCAEMNGLIESVPHLARKARAYGWKLSRYADPTSEPFFDAGTGQWALIDDHFNRTTTNRKAA